VEWWTKPPFHAQPHSIQECTDGTFTTCGANVSPSNPIGYSNFFAGGAVANTLRYGPIQFTSPGTFYYRCDVHPLEMFGRITIMGPTPTLSPHPGTGNPPEVGGHVGLVGDGTSGSIPATESSAAGRTGTIALIALAAVSVLVAVGALSLWGRASARRIIEDDRED
jgi:hypothetical protein